MQLCTSKDRYGLTFNTVDNTSYNDVILYVVRVLGSWPIGHIVSHLKRLKEYSGRSRIESSTRTKCNVCLESGFEAEQVEHVAHVDERLAHLAVYGAEEVERHREIQEEAVDHHEVADGHVACAHVRHARVQCAVQRTSTSAYR